MTSCHLSKKWSKYMIVVGVFRRGARLRRRRRSDMTWDKRTVSGMGRFLAGSGAELWGIALRHPGCDMVESSGGICALNLVHTSVLNLVSEASYYGKERRRHQISSIIISVHGAAIRDFLRNTCTTCNIVKAGAVVGCV